MPSAETATSTDTGTGTTGVRWQRGELILAIGVFVALMAALLPLLKVVDPSAWVAGAVFVPLAVLAAGCGARWYRLPAVAVSLIEAGVWVVLITLVFLRDTALVGIIPTLASIEVVPALVRQAVDEIIVGAAPLTASPALAFLIVGSMGLLTIVIDHVVITARMPLVAAVGLVAVSLIPSIAV
ncbi:MAG: transglutaminase domain-containing protein, partial [Microbacterium sp.]|nr:transglutaminase domain-containing protein [Microbacterium sp.]